MARQWTFGQKIGAGFLVMALIGIAVGVVAIIALRSVVASKDEVIAVNARLLTDAERLRGDANQMSASVRGYLLTRDTQFLEQNREAFSDAQTAVQALERAAASAEEKQLVQAVSRTLAEYSQSTESVVAAKENNQALDVVAQTFEREVLPRRVALKAAMNAFIAAEEMRLESARKASSERAESAIWSVSAMSALAIAFAVVVAFGLSRTLSRQVGTAVGHVRNSSTELQAAANQQATGAKEQATAMSEITTTISELLATSRQIAASAQRVAGVAEQTAEAARAGEGTVGRAHESIASIRRQVDLVVTHMVGLGKNSQQIGVVLDIVSELAEQTNILAINATIEAAGAGDSGRRFAVVADEIRKLADRVAGSAKEIRVLIDDIQSAVNTAVMATETGSKAVDVGAHQFGDVANLFRHIVSLVVTTTEAAREIELSTKQQSTAVEQVNLAIGDVAQAARETEASSGQTLQTASQLAGLSRELLGLVRAEVAA
ncbi:HAMP domain-containing methyl-accepting chemotaxis protein [Tahibacter amnicola]|uniref:Methyl-accepting chemotaxis protein n=1 Tax=Tahibacter amnicola TaxID=2976241 RepID=A0ABY6BAU5_9GAMM|nr:methyl-accepting chemotaxis protein [Tahibacter amnicola]UXI66652.1 methyl-accepting chemotaxis protein [Tahibacter amnicola]